MKRITLIILAVAAILAIIGCQNAPQSTPQESITVECHNGKMVGYREGHLAIFKGIPFATPPVGELRWKDPVEAPESDKEIICKKYGHVAIQAQDITGSEPAAGSLDKDEDCLTLNIWTQDFNPDTKKAVMFYIHGGAYALGGTVDPLYDGQYLASADPDIIVVTANYRVSLLGFMPLDNVPGYTDEYKNAGLLGILDQQMALKWVKRNIAKFGGDPDNVTIFGESAGGGSVACHLVMPSSKGLFKRGIMMSGESSLTGPRIASVNQAGDDKALNMAKHLMTITGKSDLAGLKSLSKEQLIAALESEEVPCGGLMGGGSLGSLVSFPVFDDGPDAVLPNPFEALKNGAGSEVELMVGCNFDEMSYFAFLQKDITITNPEYAAKYPHNKFSYWNAYCDYAIENIGTGGQGVKDAFKKYIEECPSEMEKYTYDPDPEIWRKTDLLTELFFHQGAILTADLHSKKGTTFMYYFGVPHNEYSVRLNNPWLGACHVADVPYAFNNYDHPYYDSSQAALRRNWSRAFINFAKTGNPGWAQYDSKDRKTMVIDRNGKMEVVSNPRKERNDILQPVFLNYFNARTVVTTPKLGKN